MQAGLSIIVIPFICIFIRCLIYNSQSVWELQLGFCFSLLTWRQVAFILRLMRFVLPMIWHHYVWRSLAVLWWFVFFCSWLKCTIILFCFCNTIVISELSNTLAFLFYKIKVSVGGTNPRSVDSSRQGFYSDDIYSYLSE